MITNNSEIVFMTIIAAIKQKDALTDALSSAGGHLINTIYGKGAVKPGYLMERLGLVSEEKKVVITSVISKEKAEAVFEILLGNFHFDKPNTGVAFTVPVDMLSL